MNSTCEHWYVDQIGMMDEDGVIWGVCKTCFKSVHTVWNMTMGWETDN